MKGQGACFAASVGAAVIMLLCFHWHFMILHTRDHDARSLPSPFSSSPRRPRSSSSSSSSPSSSSSSPAAAAGAGGGGGRPPPDDDVVVGRRRHSSPRVENNNGGVVGGGGGNPIPTSWERRPSAPAAGDPTPTTTAGPTAIPSSSGT